MLKQYTVKVGFDGAEATLKVDTDKFTKEMANATLTFFLWEYDDENDPIDEVVQKYAIQAIIFATDNGYNLSGVISEFKTAEGFGLVDGSHGIELLSVDGLDFHDLEVELETKIL